MCSGVLVCSGISMNRLLDAIWMVWGISVWFGWYLASVGGIGLVYDGKRFWGGTWPDWGILGVVWGVSTDRPEKTRDRYDIHVNS